MKRGIWQALMFMALFTVSEVNADPGVCALDDEADPAQQAVWETVTSTVKISQALMITSTKVVNDTARTFDACNTSAPGTPGGKWTFGYIMRKLAGSQDVSTFTLNWLNTWASDATINGFSVPKRSNISTVISSWPKLSNGALDVDKAPFRLSAIVNRVDLASFSSTSTYGNSNTNGEGRLIFNYYKDCSTPQSFNVIFEFKLPAKFSSTVSTNTKQWASYWNSLSGFSDFTSDYKVKLQEITDSFISAANLGQVRTNEIFLSSPWELREFKLSSPTNGQLKLMSTAVTMDDTKNNSTDLVNFLNNNATGIVGGTVLPPSSWLGGRSSASTGNEVAWAAAKAASLTSDGLDARHSYGINTCNGCHTTETATYFTHVGARKAGSPASLSDFLKGSDLNAFDFKNANDPVTAEPLQFNELDCRALDSYDLIKGTTNGGLRTMSSARDSNSQPALRSPSERVPRSRVH